MTQIDLNSTLEYKILKNVYFDPMYKCLYDSYGHLIKESVLKRGRADKPKFENIPDHLDISKIKFKTIKGSSVYCGCLDGIWGHFLLEFSNRLWFTFQYPDFNKYNKWFYSESYNKKPFLKYLIREKFLKNINRLPLKQYSKFNKLYLPYSSFQLKSFGYKSHSLFFNYVANTLKNKYTTEYDLVYISRSKLPKKLRKIHGENKIESLIKSLGGIIIYPEQLSIPEQINYINSSKIIIGCVGSAFHSLLFRVNKDPYKVIILTVEKKYTNKNYKLVDSVKNIDTLYLYETLSKDLNSKKTGAARNMIANIDKIKEILPNIINKILL